MPEPDPSPKPRRLKPRSRVSWARHKMDEMEARFRRRFWHDLRAGLPGIAGSILLHALLLFLCTLFYMSLNRQEPPLIELGWAVDRPTSETATARVESPIALPEVSMNSPAKVPSPVETPVETGLAEPAQAPVVAPVNVTGALDLRRNRENRRARVPTSNGDQPEDAIAMGLRWLSQQQSGDGSWSLQGPYDDGGSIETRTGGTALALLCFLGDGQTHLEGDYRETVKKGLQWLQGVQRPSGDLFDSLEEGKEAHFYAHAQASIVLCEALALTSDETLRPAAEKSIDFLVKAQNPVLGGWKYRPLTESGIGDLSVTGWVLMAMHSARMARITVPEETFVLASRFIDSVQESPGDGSRYKYRPDLPAEDSQRWSMSAEGLLCRQWLGWPRDQAALVRGLDNLTTIRFEPSWGANQRNVYAWYYTAQALHNRGGQRWEEWYSRTSSLIMKHQQKSGKTRGSWHPFRPAGAFHERSRDGGRLYLTALCLLVLETPYRHAPLYQ